MSGFLSGRTSLTSVATENLEDGAVTTAKIADVNVSTGKVADDAVTLAKMAPGTDGNLITYDASGNPAAVATGSSTNVLTSNGAGAAPTFQAASSVAQAIQSAIEAETNQDTYIPPDLLKFSPGVAKTWGSVTYSGGTPSLDLSYNITSITDSAIGVLGVTIAVDHSSANYCIGSDLGIASGSNSVAQKSVNDSDDKATTGFTLMFIDADQTNINYKDPVNASFSTHGDQ